MAESPAFYELINLHAELGGRIKANRTEAAKLRRDMMAVEKVLHILKPTFNARAIAAKRKNNPNPLFKHGTIFREALGVLRQATAPMTPEEIAAKLFEAKGASPTYAQKRRLNDAVRSSLENHDGKIVVADEGRPRRWQIAQHSI